jgi:hypothetical protein
MLQCGFETLAQCQDMSSGPGGDCFRHPFIAGAANAYAYAPIARKHRQKQQREHAFGARDRWRDVPIKASQGRMNATA